MQQIVIEGTWEEIERRKAELIGRQLRVMILPEAPARKKNGTAKSAQAQPRRVSAMGKYPELTSTEEFMREKQEEIAREDRSLR